MVLSLAIPARELWGLKDLITTRHIELMCKVILATGMMVGYAYSTEFFVAWYSGNRYEGFAFINRAFGPYWWAYTIMVSCNVLVPQIFWFKKMRTNMWVVFIAAALVNVGMWFERFVIVVSSLNRDFLPSSWHYFTPTAIDLLTFLGSFGLFLTLFLLFCRYLPQVAIAEIKGVMPQAHAGHGGSEATTMSDSQSGQVPPEGVR